MIMTQARTLNLTVKHSITTDIKCLNYVGSQGIATIPSGLQYASDNITQSSQAAHEEQIRHDLMYRFVRASDTCPSFLVSDSIKGSPGLPRTQITESDSSVGEALCLVPRSLFETRTQPHYPVHAPPLLDDDLDETLDDDRSSAAIDRKAAMARLKKFPDVEEFMPLPKLIMSRPKQLDAASLTRHDTTSTGQSTEETTAISSGTLAVVN